MINILFVDDESNILQGLQRLLRPMRHEWQMFFAESGADAQVLLAENPIDVVVSDMRMPGMDGAQLLHEIRDRYPQIVRIILSGYSEKEMIVRSVHSAHQYLMKPCDPEILRETISRACALRDILADENLRRFVSQMRSVPSLPTLYTEMMKELEYPEPRMDRIGDIVEKDIGMTVKILQLVNSAFFGLRRPISDAYQAINYLGFETIRVLTLGIGVFSQLENSGASKDINRRLWAHSLAVGTTAKLIAQKESPSTAADAYTAGLLHAIGEIVLAVNMPEKFAAVQKLVSEEGMSRIAAEREIFQTTNAEVGAYLVGLWGLPHQVVEAIAFHNTPSDFQTDEFSPLTAVHVANSFYNQKNAGVNETDGSFDMQYLKHLGLMEKLPQWREKYMQNGELN
jgi:HD-like signal output (HDOD) protein/CheY-like chemotaxis protein